VRADDALLLDNSYLSIDEQVEIVLDAAEKRILAMQAL
jgi:cytidylate kinase